MKASPLVAVGLALLLAAPVARAGGAEDDARKTFEEGLEAERNGQASACGKFRKALELIREVGPLKKVKECDAREGKLLLAREKLKELISRWPQQDAELDGFKSELLSVEARIAHIDLTLAPGAPPGVQARVDAKPVAIPSTGIELDPGEHEILVEVPGKAITRRALTLGDGETKTLELPANDAVAPPPVAPQRPVESSEGGLGGLGIAGIIVGAVGVGAFVGAGVTGGMVLSKKDEFDACNGNASCTKLATLEDDGNTLLVANGVLFGLGIAGVGVGATLLVIDLATGSSDDPAPATVSVGPTGAKLSVRF